MAQSVCHVSCCVVRCLWRFQINSSNSEASMPNTCDQICSEPSFPIFSSLFLCVGGGPYQECKPFVGSSYNSPLLGFFLRQEMPLHNFKHALKQQLQNHKKSNDGSGNPQPGLVWWRVGWRCALGVNRWRGLDINCSGSWLLTAT